MGPAKHIGGLIDSVPSPCNSEQGIVIGASARRWNRADQRHRVARIEAYVSSIDRASSCLWMNLGVREALYRYAF